MRQFVCLSGCETEGDGAPCTVAYHAGLGAIAATRSAKRFTAYGVTLGDDPVAQAMKGLIDHTAGHEHQIALLWAAIEKLSGAVTKPAECVPGDAQKEEDFDADHLKQLMR